MSTTPQGFFTKDSPVINYLTVNGGLPYFDYTTDGNGTTTVTKFAGVLPQGAQLLLSGHAAVETAFNGTSPSVLLGITGTTDAIMAAGDITEGTTGLYAVAAASLKSGGFHVPAAADTPIYITYSVSGSPTAGKVRFAIPYVMKALPNGY